MIGEYNSMNNMSKSNSYNLKLTATQDKIRDFEVTGIVKSINIIGEDFNSYLGYIILTLANENPNKYLKIILSPFLVEEFMEQVKVNDKIKLWGNYLVDETIIAIGCESIL